MKKILIIIPLLFLLTGCYNYRELNDLAIVSAIAIDYKLDEFNITIQIVNPKKQQDVSSANEPEFLIYESSDKTLQSAFRKIVNTSSNRIYGSHLQVLIISEEVATNHMDKILDFFAREPEARSEFYVMIAKDNSANDEISITTPLINLSSTSILKLIETNNKNLGIAKTVTFNELLNDYLNPYKEISLPSIKIIGDNIKESDSQKNLEKTNTDSKIKIATTGLFKNKKLIGFLNEEDSIGLNILLNNTNTTITKYKCSNNEYIVSEINSIKSKIDADLKNKTVNIKISGHSILSEINCNLNIKNNKVIDMIESNINKEIKQLIVNSINTIQFQYKTDALNIKDILYKNNPKYLNDNINNWDDLYQELEFNVDVNLKLYEKGNTLGGIEYEKDKY